jgi:hypothetical protein
MSTTTITAPRSTPGWFRVRLSSLLKRQPAVPAAVPVAPVPTVSERRAPSLAMLAAALRMPHGASSEELHAALATNKAHPDLVAELVDDYGFPVACARSAQAVDPALQEEIADWLAANAMAGIVPGDEAWRALLLGTAVMRDLADHAMVTLMPAQGEPPMLHVIAMLPSGWPLAQREAAALWWQHTLVQSGWPAARIIADQQAHSQDVAPATLLARLAHDVSTSPTPTATIVLASASHIGQDTVDRWSARNMLFTSHHPHGHVPGEGAAGLLLADARLASSGEGADLVHINLEYEQTDPAAASQKRYPPECLNRLAERVFEGAAVPSASVVTIIADTGPDPRAVLELMAFGAASTSHLDGSSDILRLGPACGACEGVPFIAALALARQAALEHKAPMLCVSNNMPGLRAVALVRHAQPL